jgi:hypothetical protein
MYIELTTSRSIDENEAKSSTYMILSTDVIEVITSSSLKIERIFTSIINEHNNTIKNDASHNTLMKSNSTTTIRNDSMKFSNSNKSLNKLIKSDKNKHLHGKPTWIEGRTTCIYWCSYTSQLILGYSSGGTGIMKVINKEESNMSWTLIDSRNIHSTSIESIVTFIIPKNENDSTTVKKTAMLICDSTGIISVWQIYPR